MHIKFKQALRGGIFVLPLFNTKNKRLIPPFYDRPRNRPRATERNAKFGGLLATLFSKKGISPQFSPLFRWGLFLFLCEYKSAKRGLGDYERPFWGIAGGGSVRKNC